MLHIIDLLILNFYRDQYTKLQDQNIQLKEYTKQLQNQNDQQTKSIKEIDGKIYDPRSWIKGLQSKLNKFFRDTDCMVHKLVDSSEFLKAFKKFTIFIDDIATYASQDFMKLHQTMRDSYFKNNMVKQAMKTLQKPIKVDDLVSVSPEHAQELTAVHELTMNSLIHEIDNYYHYANIKQYSDCIDEIQKINFSDLDKPDMSKLFDQEVHKANILESKKIEAKILR